MASTAEKLASNMNFGSLSQASELKKRIWFTLFALIVYRIGSFIPLPNIDPVVLDQIMQQHSGGILSMFNMFSGGALVQMLVIMNQNSYLKPVFQR